MISYHLINFWWIEVLLKQKGLKDDIMRLFSIHFVWYTPIHQKKIIEMN